MAPALEFRRRIVNGLVLSIFCLVTFQASFVLALRAGVFQQEKRDDTPEEQQVHSWTDSSGKFKVQAVLLEFANKNVKLEKNNGEVIDVPYSMLSPRSKSLAKKLQKKIEKAQKMSSSGNKNPFGEDVDGEADDQGDHEKPKADKKKNVEKKNPFAGELDDIDAGDEAGHAGVMANAAPPNPECPRCRGKGLVGEKKFKPWVITRENDARNINKHPVAASCPRCQKGVNPRANSITYTSEHDAIAANHNEWAQALGQPMTLVQTRFMVLHSQFSDAETEMVAQALEGFEWHLQRTFGSLHFSNRSRSQDELFLLTNKPNYMKFIDVLKARVNQSTRNWELTKRVAFSNYGPISFQQRQQSLQQMLGSAVYGTANLQINRALNGHGKGGWIRTGFSAHFEKVVTKTNHCFMSGGKQQRYAPEREQAANGGQDGFKLRQFKFKGNWDEGILQMAEVGRLVPWDTMIYLTLRDYEITHDLQAKSMVGFLIQQPKKFEKMIDLIGTGIDQMEAMEKAYEMKMPAIEAAWITSLR